MGEQEVATIAFGDPQAVFETYRAHNSGLRIHTDSIIQTTLVAQYPSHCLTSTTCDLIKYAEAGHATATLTDDVHPTLRSWSYQQAARRTSDGSPQGTLREEILFGRYDYDWKDHKFQVLVVDGQNTTMGRCDRRFYVLSHATNKGMGESLVLAASVWSEQSHNEVWVYDQGWWSKDKELWRVVQDSKWEDVILDEGLKRAIMRDVTGFFDAKNAYAEFGTPWKRGLIFHGSPGNGKTTTAKALMKALMTRSDPIPTLYVKTLAQRGYSEQMSVRQIFKKARQTAPCLLLFEDVDSLVTEHVRSYFLNEVDGLEDNDGILMIGSTNNLDKLDPSLSKRPSRFDRKYRFGNPSFEDRERYCRYWREKLSSRTAAATPVSLPHRIASITEGFSFAYLKETYVAALLALVRDSADDTIATEEGKENREWGRLGNLLQKQTAVLREEMADADKSEAEREREEQKRKTAIAVRE